MAFALDVELQPVRNLDGFSRFTALLARAEPRVRKRFLQVLQRTRRLDDLDELERLGALLQSGQIDEALRISDEIAPALAATLETVYTSFGMSAAEVLRSQVDTAFDFSTLNPRAVRFLQESRASLIRELSQQQRAATLEILGDSFQRGLAPIEQARRLKQSIGLTSYQGRAVVNYRRALEEGDARALARELRDRRFDSTVRRALSSRGSNRVPLTQEQIDRMVQRYTERFVAFRAETIALTETQAAAGEADAELWKQAVDDGVVDPEDVVGTWHTAADERVRPSHQFMHLQTRPLGEPFLSGDGNRLMYPGDRRAPASDVIRCRCVVGRDMAAQARTR